MDLRAVHDYDRWANHQWMSYLESIGSPETEMAVFSHQLAAAKMWATRLNGEHPTGLAELIPTAAEIDAIAESWRHIISRGTTGDVAFRRFNGEEVVSSIESVVVHVANHGTYHRGELRGLCRAAGREGFPETDFFLWDRLGRP